MELYVIIWKNDNNHLTFIIYGYTFIHLYTLKKAFIFGSFKQLFGICVLENVHSANDVISSLSVALIKRINKKYDLNSPSYGENRFSSK